MNLFDLPPGVALTRLLAAGLLFFVARAQSATPSPKTVLLEPGAGMYVALADMGFWNHEDYATTSQSTPAHQAKKLLDLSGLVEPTWKELRAAEVSIFMFVDDNGGDGLDERFDIVINGHTNSLPTKGLVKTGKGWFDMHVSIGWFNFAIPRDQLRRSINEIILQKSPGTTDGDDTLQVGIDMFQRQDGSYISFDGGRVWAGSPLNRPLKQAGYPDFGHDGELMIRLNLYRDPALAGKESFKQEDLPPLPPVDLNPPVASLPMPTLVTPRFSPGVGEDTLENGWLRVVVAHGRGLALSAFTHKPVGKNALAGSSTGSLFVAEVAGRRIGSQEFSFKTRAELQGGLRERKVIYELRHGETGIEAAVSFRLDEGPELMVGLAFKNASAQPRRIKVVFPMITGIEWSADLVDDWYLFPYGVGAISKHPSKFISAYGGGKTCFQQMVSYSPSAGGGLYLRVNDKTGEYKLLHLTRSERSGAEPAFALQPVIGDMIHGRLRPDFVLLQPLPKVSGTSLAVGYQQRNLEPNGQWIFPSVSLGVFNGDWRQAMASYRRWFESGAPLRPYPNKLTATFNLDSVSAAHHYHGAQGYKRPADKGGKKPWASGVSANTNDWAVRFDPDSPDEGVVFGADASFENVAEGTVMLWLRQNSEDPEGRIFQKGNDGKGYTFLAIVSRGKFLFESHNGTGKLEAWGLPVGQWVHVAVSWSVSNDVKTLWINGEDVATGGFHVPFESKPSLPFAIGADPGGHPNRVFDGAIDELKIFNFRLSAEQVKAERLNNRAPGQPPPVHHYRMDDRSRKTIADAVPNGFNGRFLGASGTAPDLVEHTSYWEWDEVTEDYLKENRKIARQHGQNFTLWPGRHGPQEGKHYFWGNQGDYGTSGYNERWGGLPAFRHYLNELKREGCVATLYINQGEMALSSKIGRQHGPDWSVMHPPGRYFWPYWMWEGCMDNPAWRGYLAETCRRLIAETGADGIRIDEFGGASRICSSTRHPHTFARPGEYVTLQAQAEACRQIRLAVDQVNPNAVLMSETPGIDLMWQHLDGSLDYSFTESVLTGGRAGDWEGFVGINLHGFYFPRFKVYDYNMHEKRPAWRFFNAVGAFNREFYYRDRELQILRENSDVFASLQPEPMIPTLMPRVYVNQFSGEQQTLYMVYNARRQPISGDVLEVEFKRDFQFVDLMTGRELQSRARGSRTVVPLELAARSATCLQYAHNSFVAAGSRARPAAEGSPLPVPAAQPEDAKNFSAPAPQAPFVFSLGSNECVAFLGGTATVLDREQSYLETLLTCRFAGRHVQFRNLAWEGDTVFRQDRRPNFGDLTRHLKAVRATVIFGGFGLVESFEGPRGVPGFVEAYQGLLERLTEGRRRAVLLSPFQPESAGGTLLDLSQAKRNLPLYVDAIRQVGRTRGLPTVDLYHAFDSASAEAAALPLTSNGIHPSAYGYWRAARHAEQALGLPARHWRVEIRDPDLSSVGTQIRNVQRTASSVRFQLRDELLPAPRFSRATGKTPLVAERRTLVIAGLPPGRHALNVDGQRIAEATHDAWAGGVELTQGPEFDQVESLRALIVSKNIDWFNYWRPQNWEFLYGDVTDQASSRRHDNPNVRWFPEEMKEFLPMIADKEAQIQRRAVPVERQYELFLLP